MNHLHKYLSSLGIPTSHERSESHPPRAVDQVPFPNTTVIHTTYGVVYLIFEPIPIANVTYPKEIPVEFHKWLGTLDANNGISIEDFLFIDVETSGGYGGAGVICFLVGVGQIIEREIQLSQYLILHPEDEVAQLMELEKRFLSVKGIMTYNGKSFDLPLIQSRFQFHQMPLQLQELLHLDLLHLSRKIWKNHLPNLTLRTMEANLLGIERSIDDIPGWMIPNIYRDFLLSQDASFLFPVIYHNKMDVVSLVQLYLHIAKLFTHPMDGSFENTETIFHLANFYRLIGENMRAIEAYTACQEYLKEESQRIQLFENLALLYKKLNQYDKAEESWLAAARLGSLKAILELAKYYERTKKDRAIARHWIVTAQKILDTKKMDRFERAKWQSELQYRLKRLDNSRSSKDI